MYIPQLCVLGHVSIDTVVSHEGVLDEHVGGAAYAAGVGAAMFTRDVGIVSRVGGDFPERAALQDAIRGWHVRRVEDASTSRFYLDYREKDVTRGFRADLGIGATVKAQDIPVHWMKASVHVSTMPPAQQLRATSLLRKHNCRRISLDVLEAYVQSDLAACVRVAATADLLFANEFEWVSLAQAGCPNPPVLIKKCGMNGAQVFVRGQLVAEAEAPKIVSVDPTNAGDVFAGAFLAVLERSNDVAESLGFAVAAASTCVQTCSPDAILNGDYALSEGRGKLHRRTEE